MHTPTIGVLALQGDVREHARALEAAGARAVPVRRPAELETVDGIVLPGGESTTIDKLLHTFELAEPMRARIQAGMPAYGSCAGMILLADRVKGGIEGQRTLGGIDMTVRRNAFGRQVDSFETDLDFSGLAGRDGDRPLHAVFIRAPWVEDVGPEVEVLARTPKEAVRGGDGDGRGQDRPGEQAAAGRIVAVRQGWLLATSFHPEVTGDLRVHELFATIVRDAA